MRRNIYRAFFSIILLLFIITVSSAAESLHIVSVKPQGELRGIWESNQITVTFNTAMVELQKIEDTEPEWWHISPQADGSFQWIGTHTLAFKPAEQLPYASEFSVTIKANAEALNGARLKQDYRWSFQTPTPYVRYTYPRKNEKSVDIKTSITINFSVKVNPADVFEFIKLFQSENKEVKSSINYDIINESSEATHQIILKPLTDLQKDTEYLISVKKGMPASEGTLGSKTEWRSTFRTYSVFKFISLNDNKTTGINPLKFISLKFTNPVKYKHLLENMKFDPPIPIADNNYDYHNSTIRFYGPFLPDTTYHLSISDELTDIFNNKLLSPVSVTFKTRSYDPRYTVPTGESVLEAYGDLNIPIEVVNLKNIEVKIKSVSYDSVDLLGDWFRKQSTYSKKDVFANNFTTRTQVSTEIQKNKTKILPLNLKKYLPDGNHGIVLIQFFGKEGNQNANPYKLALPQVTEIGITAKFSPVSNAIYITRLKDGKPYPNVHVQLRDGSGKVYWSGVSDDAGYCESPGWQRLGMPVKKNREPVQWIVAKYGSDIAYTHSERGTGISPWEFHIPYEWNPRDEQLDGAIFTDRGLYRAEDTVRVKVVVREKYGLEWKLAARDSFEITINDPAGKKVYNKYHHLNDFNAFDFDFILPYDAKRGNYYINMKIPQKYRWEDRIFESFWVEDFRPAEFEVTVHPQQSEYVFGDTLKSSLNASYLFGAPLKNAPVKWSVFKTHYFHNPPGWDGYYFHPEKNFFSDGSGIGKFMSYTISEQDKLDENGAFQVTHFTSEPNLQSSAKYLIEGEVEDQNRRKIAGRKSVIVFRGDYLVGIKPESFFGTKNKSYSIHVITSNPDGEVIPNREVELLIKRRNWYSVRKAGTGGRYSWESKITDSTVVNTKLKTGKKPVTYQFMPNESGYYLMRATSIDERGNKIVADCSFYIIGSDYVAWMRSDDDRIELETDKLKYKPGESATVLIKSPFDEATALVTIEREGIVDHFVQDVTGSTPTIKIPIRDIYLPNVYVSVMLIQGRTGNNVYSETGEDIAKPAFKLGYTQLKVESEAKKLRVHIETDKKSYKPGEQITINFEAIDQKGTGEESEIIVAVVDKGVLNLRGYRFTNLHEYFYKNRPLSVTTSESRLNIIGQRNYGEKGENRGGGGSMEMANFEIRKDFKSTAYWNPGVKTNEQGKASVTFKLPDNLTTFVIMAAVHNKASEFGNGEYDFKVNKPLLLKPALPRFVRFQDVFSAGTVVHNYSEKKGNVRIKVEPRNIQLLDNSNYKSIALTAGESREVRFQFKANSIGTAEFTFMASMGQESDAVIKSIPVLKPLSYEVVATANSSTENADEKIIVPDNCYPAMTTLEVKTSSTQLIGISDGVNYLFEYPYGCLEQKLSRVLPMILFENVIEAFKIPALNNVDYRKVVQEFFDQLSDFQAPDGGFRYWPKTGYPNPYISAWTVFALIKGKDADYKIDKNMLKNATAFLRKVLSKEIDRDLYPYSWNYWAVTNCLILYDFALQKKADHGYIEKLFQEKERIPYFGLAYLLKTMKYVKSDESMYKSIQAIILNGLKEAPTMAHFEEADETGLEWCFHSNVRTTAHLLQSLLELKEEFPAAHKVVKWLLLKRNMRGVWRNTQDNIYVLYALSTYFNVYEKEKPDFALTVQLASKQVLETLFKGYGFQQESVNVDLTSFKPGKTLNFSFNKKGDGRYYYETRLKYYPHSPLERLEQGISILKNQGVVEGELRKDGSITAGSVVKVTLTAATSMERNYVVVDDPLPAGFEVINTRLKTVSKSYEQHEPLVLHSSYWGGFNYFEIRDDKMLIFADNLPSGVHTFTYLCRALTAGAFLMPSTKIEEMYTPEVFGRTKDEEIIIR